MSMSRFEQAAWLFRGPILICCLSLSVANCSTDSITGTAPAGTCVGTSCTDSENQQDLSGDLMFPDRSAQQDTVAEPDIAEVSETDLPDISEDVPECDIRNLCGGCHSLGVELGGPCGQCSNGTWQCDGENRATCVGDTETEYFYTDSDRDGFGNPEVAPLLLCSAPSEYYADNADDCDDSRDYVNPEASEVCNGLNDDCDDETDEAPSDDCSDSCCEDSLICEDGNCLIPCEGIRCGTELDLCCTGDEMCFAGSCIVAEEGCEFTEDCPLGEFCEGSLGLCITRDIIPECEYRPPPGEFAPRVGCRWTSDGLPNPSHDDVVATPIAINLTDDNEDGRTDPDDIPDIAFLTYNLGASCCNTPATLRIVSGQCNEDGTMNTWASIDSPVLTNDAGIAAADLIGDDGVPEIVAIGFYGNSGSRPEGTVAFQRVADDGTEWEVAWENKTYPSWAHSRGSAAISIADLDGNGVAEVVIGNIVLNGQTGDLIWDGTASNPEETVGIGNNAFLGPSSAVEDVNLDGFLEVAAGNTLYDYQGNELWTIEYESDNSRCGGSLPCDGFNAVANFDDDEYGEVVIVRRGEIFIIEHTGELLWKQEIPLLASNPCTYNESGPPTVADFDGDGRLEIGTAAADFYVVADMDCDPDEGPVPEACASRGILWRVRNNDCSSRVTASSVFDFEGDGAAEVVYADETNFRIFSGATGEILFDDESHGSHTRLEMPIIADVDNDGNAEIVIPENGSRGGTPGVEVWIDRDDNWVRTRRVWNQHAYSITHITEGGRVPADQEPNWSNPRFNNFRQNVQPDGLFDAPDFELVELNADVYLCQFRVELTIVNSGALSTPAGVPIRVTVSNDEIGEEVGIVRTSERLLPGGRETIRFELSFLEEVPDEVQFRVLAEIDPDNAYNECVEENNSLETIANYICLDKN